MTEPLRVAAIVPVASIEGAKTRLGESLDAEERRDLVERLLATTLGAALAVDRLADVLVVSPDRDVLTLAATAGARTLRQRTSGLNAAVGEARDDVVAGGAGAVVILPVDLPFITSGAVTELLAPLDEDDLDHLLAQVAVLPGQHHDPRDGRLKLIEVNPRLWQWHGLTGACGADVALAAYWDLVGDRRPPKTTEGCHKRWAISIMHGQSAASRPAPPGG